MKFKSDIQAESKVGIGTNTVNYPLDARAGSANSDVAQFTGANDSRGLKISTFQLGAADDSVDYDCQYNGAAPVPPFGVQTWSMSGNEKMRLTQGGTLGIGTVGGSDPLVVRNGTTDSSVKILSFNNAAGTEAILKFSTIASETNYVKAAIIARNAAGSFGRSDMHFALDSAADTSNVQFSDTKMTILNGGNVGIGTITPIYNLDVDGAIRASEGFIDNEDNSALRVVSPPGGSYRSTSAITGAIEVTIPNKYVKDNVTFTLEVKEAAFDAYTIKIAMAGFVGVDLQPSIVSAYLTSDAGTNNNCTIEYDPMVPEFDDVKIYIVHPLGGFATQTGIFITEFTVPATVAAGNLAWGLNITSVPAAATGRRQDIQVTNWKRNGQDLYYGSGTGDVGIGTTNPGSKLEVAGEIDATTGDGYKINGKPWANNLTNVLNLGDWDGEGFSTIIYDENSRGVVKIKDYGTTINTSGLSSSYGSRASLAVGTIGNESAGAGVITLANNDTTASAGDPTGEINFAIKADNANTLGYTSAIISGSIFTTAGLGNSGGGILDFKTSPASAGSSPQTRIRINQLGDVGIGTTSPIFKLDLGINAVNLNTATNKQIVLNVNGGYTGQTTDQYKVIGYTGSIASNTDIFTQTSGENLKNFYTGVFGGAFFNSSRWGLVQGGSTRFCVLGGTAANGAGNVGIGTTSPGAKLDVAGNIIVSGGVSNENDGVRVTNPGGASFITQTGSVAGAIKITLPQAGINTMMRMEVKVYEYLTNESFTVQCGGYTHSASQWNNEYAYIESSAKDDRNFTVRFGYDGSKSCIYIGELTSAWSYPQVFVTEFQGGFQNPTALKYQDGWDISFEASAFQGVLKTQADTQINNWARSGTNTYYASSTGNVGIGDTTPSYKLDVTGEGRFTGDLRCLSLIQTSQSDKKESISDIVKTTNKKIEFKEYVYKSDSGNRKRYGVLAEDIEINYPELVHVDADGVKGVNYIDLLVKRVSELEKEIEDIAPRSMFLNWRGYHSSTNNGVLYDSGWSTNLTYPYATIIAPFKGSVTKVSITNNPYSSYQSGPTGDRATLEVVIDGRVVDGATVNYSKPSANEMITFNFSGNHEFSENDKVQLRFQSNGLWRYINTGIQLKETI